MKELYNLFLFASICLIVYIIFRNFHFGKFQFREGMTDASGNTIVPPSDGIAGNAASYAASLKAATIKAEDTLLISKYRTDYENAILNLDELLNTHMLNIALTVNPSNVTESVAELSKCQQSLLALNSVMKFVDSK
jgi:hypothetical protein